VNDMVAGFFETSVYLYTYILHGVPSQKSAKFIGTTLRRWNLVQMMYSCNILACSN